MTLVLVGGGGHCRSCIDVVRGAGFSIAGVIDPLPAPEILGLPRLGDDSWLDGADARSMDFLVTVGQVGLSPHRRRLFEALRIRKLPLASIVAIDAIVSPDTAVGDGCIVMHRAVINSGATLGVNAIINTGAIIEHDARLGDHCHISTGAIVNGDARIGDGCMIGSGAIILQGVHIAADVVIGAGAVVTRTIDTPGIWVGVPARRQA